MFKFLLRLGCFLGLLILVIVIGIMLPATPRASTAHLFAKIDKDSLLRNASSPRIILIGGSNLSMSINSQLLKDSLQLFPINTGLSASIGLLYMLDSSLPHVRPGDIVVVCPEYSQFYDNLQVGTEDLVRVVLDNRPVDIFRLRSAQFFNCLKYIPRYAFSKFKLTDYFHKPDTVEVYQRRSFNRYGDMDKHWRLEKRPFSPLASVEGIPFDESALLHLDEFKRKIAQRGASLYVTFPAIDAGSFQNQQAAIDLLVHKLRTYEFHILGDPGRYKMPADYMFDTPYHLTQPGVDFRTRLLIEDIRSASYTRVASYVLHPNSKRSD